MSDLKKIKLVTDDLTTALDENNRKQLVGNFTTTEDVLNKIIDWLNSDDTSEFVNKKDLEDKLKDLNKQIIKNDKALKERINRILLGTDVESIELVVTRLLKEKGVID
jgi:uncharacterized membrane protein YheB (UPF0754 family)